MSNSAGMTVRAIITSLGGVVAVAKALEVDRTTVLDWIRSNAFPPSRVVQIHRKYETPLDVLLAPVPVARPKKVHPKAAAQASAA